MYLSVLEVYVCLSVLFLVYLLEFQGSQWLHRLSLSLSFSAFLLPLALQDLLFTGEPSPAICYIASRSTNNALQQLTVPATLIRRIRR